MQFHEFSLSVAEVPRVQSVDCRSRYHAIGRGVLFCSWTTPSRLSKSSASSTSKTVPLGQSRGNASGNRRTEPVAPLPPTRKIHEIASHRSYVRSGGPHSRDRCSHDQLIRRRTVLG